MATITQLQTRILTDISEQANKISYGTTTDTHTSMNTAGIYGVDPNDDWKAVEVSADGKLKTESTLDTTGLSTEAKQDTLIGHVDQVESKLDTLESGKATSSLQTSGNAFLSSLDTKIVSCNTGALATQATLASVDGKITACDTTGLATQATLSSMNTKITVCDTSTLATETTLASVNGKITACDTTGLATQATLSSLDTKITTCDTSTLATESTLTLQNTYLSNIDATVAQQTTLSDLEQKITQGNASQITDGQQVLCYARDSQGNLDALKSDQNGHLEIVISEVDSAVKFKSLDDTPTTSTQQITTSAAGGTSNSNTIDIQSKERLSFIGDITDSGASIQLQGSIDSTTWYPIETYYPVYQDTSPYGFNINVDKSAIRYFRLSYTGTTAQAETWNIATSMR